MNFYEQKRVAAKMYFVGRVEWSKRSFSAGLKTVLSVDTLGTGEEVRPKSANCEEFIISNAVCYVQTFIQRIVRLLLMSQCWVRDGVARPSNEFWSNEWRHFSISRAFIALNLDITFAGSLV